MKTQKQPQLILPGALLEAWREAAYRKTTEAQCAHSKRSFMWLWEESLQAWKLWFPQGTASWTRKWEEPGWARLFLGERAGFLGQFFAHIGHQKPCKLSFNCSPPNRLLLLYPLSLNRCFSHAMVGSFQRTTIRKLETIPMTSDWGNIRQITGHSEDGLFHSH